MQRPWGREQQAQGAGVGVVQWARADAAGDEVTESAGAQVVWAVRSSRPGFYSVKQEAVWGEAAEPCDLLQVGHPGRWGGGSRELGRRGCSSERTTIASWKEV